jgi:hypothetical protein
MVEIERENYSGSVGELSFPASSPLVIEWSERETKLKPLHGSAATLSIVSESDRAYIDLYQVSPLVIRLKVYVNRSEWCPLSVGNTNGYYLYWVGMLDTEFYEEPYSYYNDYAVTLTFSDIAVLNRIKWNVNEINSSGISGVKMSFFRIIQVALFNVANLLIDVNSITLGSSIDIVGVYELSPDGTSNILVIPPSVRQLEYMESNFKDEDDEPMTWKEVLSTILEPFGFILVQQGGGFRVYDIHWLYNNTSGREVYWAGVDARLGIDKTYNNVNVTYCPYISEESLTGKVEASEVTGGSVYKFYTAYGSGWSDAMESFNLQLENSVTQWNFDGTIERASCEGLGTDVDEAGIPLYIMYGDINSITYQPTWQSLLNNVVWGFSGGLSSHVYTLKHKPMLFVNSAVTAEGYKMKLTVPLFMDTRYNPFVPYKASQNDDIPTSGVFFYLAFQLRLKDSTGAVLYHYDNSNICGVHDHATAKTGVWLSGDYPSSSSNTAWGDSGFSMKDRALLTYYSTEYTSSPLNQGYVDNRSPTDLMVNYYPLMAFVQRDSSAGEIIPYPPVTGSLELKIYANVSILKYIYLPPDLGGAIFNWSSNYWGAGTLALRWLMMNNIKLDILDKYNRAIKAFDVSISTFIEPDAQDDIDIITYSGTLEKPHPTAKGQILYQGLPILSGIRAGYTASLEKLLCGSYYSQYSGRKKVLSGAARMDGVWGYMTDASDAGSRYMKTSEVQDLRLCRSSLKLVEIAPDSYNGIAWGS